MVLLILDMRKWRQERLHIVQGHTDFKWQNQVWMGWASLMFLPIALNHHAVNVWRKIWPPVHVPFLDTQQILRMFDSSHRTPRSD